MTRTTPGLALLALTCVLAAMQWPFTGAAGGGSPAHAVAFAGAGAGAVFTGIVVGIAWTIRDRPPAFIALGCYAMAAGMVTRIVADPIGFGLHPSAGSAMAPLTGMILGGLWFMLAALTAEPDQESGLPPARLLLVGGALATAAVCVAPVVDPSLIPDTRVLQIAAGAAAGGYLVAAIAFGRAWHLLRLPSQAAMTLGTSGFAFGIVAMAGGGLPAVAGWQFELMMLCFGALPAAGFLVEQRTRPGLRAMVLGLLLPGAAASMSRGYPGAMHRLLDAIEDYDPDLRGHVNRVAALAIRIGMRMRLNASHLREVALAAQLHDVGKIAIPRTILMKASSLTAAEFAVVQRHAAYGEQIVARLPGLSGACRGVGEHHERWDGAGYPYAREGHGISLTARIVAVADVYDALVSKRTYKEGWDRTEALAEIVRGAGSRFDPRVVDELLHVVGETEQVARAVAA